MSHENPPLLNKLVMLFKGFNLSKTEHRSIFLMKIAYNFHQIFKKVRLKTTAFTQLTNFQIIKKLNNMLNIIFEDSKSTLESNSHLCEYCCY